MRSWANEIRHSFIAEMVKVLRACKWPTAGILRDKNAAKLCAQIRISGMKKYICLVAGVALLAACEQKETTVTNPPAEKKESTTVINQSSPPTTTTKEKTDININTSPNPQ
jgi:hypothetical protein